MQCAFPQMPWFFLAFPEEPANHYLSPPSKAKMPHRPRISSA